MIVFLHFFLVGFFCPFLILFFYYAFVDAIRHARAAGGLLAPGNVRTESISLQLITAVVPHLQRNTSETYFFT